MKRRDLLKILGVSSSTMAFKNCFIERVPGKMFPYVHGSDHVIAGRPTFYATTCRECPAGCGMIVKTREGRALKAEGNPDHPINRGKLCPRGQASLQGLYNPQRYRNPLAKKLGPGQAPMHESIEWDDALGRIALIVPTWYSTLFGAYMFIMGAFGALAMMTSSESVVLNSLRLRKM
jgi:anaerobic selenocysteine-containing dehydrogenase